MKTKLTILKDFSAQVEGQLNPVTLLAGTNLEAVRIVNNGTPFLAYECILMGHRIYVKPTIGYVQVH